MKVEWAAWDTSINCQFWENKMSLLYSQLENIGKTGSCKQNKYPDV